MCSKRVYILDGEVRNTEFSAEDHQAFSNPKWAAKLEDILDKCPINMNIIVKQMKRNFPKEVIAYNFPNKLIPVEYKCDSNGIYKKITKAYNADVEVPVELSLYDINRFDVLHKDFEDYENRVNVVLNFNGGPNKLPMTQWITLHRACHAIQLLTGCNKNLSWDKFNSCMLTDYFNLFKQLLYNHKKLTDLATKKYPTTSMSSQEAHDNMVGFAKLIGNTRTLRTGNHLSTDVSSNWHVFYADFQAELWTEYMFKRKITVDVAAAKQAFGQLSEYEDYRLFIEGLDRLQVHMKQSLDDAVVQKTGKFLFF